MLLVLHNVTMASLRTFARKVAADDETWRNNNQTWARANFSFFIYFLFQIKWHFEFFFTEKWGVDIHPIHPPCIRPCPDGNNQWTEGIWNLKSTKRINLPILKDIFSNRNLAIFWHFITPVLILESKQVTGPYALTPQERDLNFCKNS